LPVRLFHVGSALDPAKLAAEVAASGCQGQPLPLARCPAAGGNPAAIKRCHLLLLPSLMEGGANVLIEAVTSGVPVLGSDIAGNRGMLGADYPGWFAGATQRSGALISRVATDARYYASLVPALRREGILVLPGA
jgi:glycosyltransferase involved in cell wall biosynthesis